MLRKIQALFIYLFFLTLILMLCFSCIHTKSQYYLNTSPFVVFHYFFSLLRIYFCGYPLLKLGAKKKKQKLKAKKQLTNTKHRGQHAQVAFPLFLYSSALLHALCFFFAALLLSVECCCSCFEFLIAQNILGYCYYN